MAFKSKRVAVFGTAVAILLSIGLLSYLKIREGDEDRRWVDHTCLVLETIGAAERAPSSLAEELTGH